MVKREKRPLLFQTVVGGGRTRAGIQSRDNSTFRLDRPDEATGAMAGLMIPSQLTRGLRLDQGMIISSGVGTDQAESRFRHCDCSPSFRREFSISQTFAAQPLLV